MLGLGWIGSVRAFATGFALAVLTACAGVPAPVAGWSTAVTPAQLSYSGVEPRVADYRARLQCVPFARNASGIQIYGNANTWWMRAEGRYPRSSTPAAGSVLVMRGYNNPGRGHVAVVTQVESSRLIRVDQANWLNNGEITVSVPVLDVSPNNDWSEVRVWHIPGRHWGGRIYQAQGFIHAFDLRMAMG